MMQRTLHHIGPLKNPSFEGQNKPQLVTCYQLYHITMAEHILNR